MQDSNQIEKKSQIYMEIKNSLIHIDPIIAYKSATYMSV